MRKQITLTPENSEVVKRMAKFLDVSQSTVINFSLILLCEYFNFLPVEIFKDNVRGYYKKTFIKQLPRGLKAKEVFNEKKKKT